MRKLQFDRTKYGRELLIDTVDHRDFDPGAATVLPDFYVMAFLAEAAGWIRINQLKLAVQNQQLFFIPPGHITNVDNFEFKRGVMVFFQDDFLDIFFNERYFTYKFPFFYNPDAPYNLNLEESAFREIFSLVQGIHLDIRYPQTDQEHFLRSSLYHLLIRINRHYSNAYQIEERVIGAEQLSRLKYLLVREIRSIGTTTELADLLGVSRTHLHGLCIRYFGHPPGQVLRHRRLLEAKKEILFSDKSIQEIAYELHFSDPSNFSRSFRQLTGHTPLQYRIEFTK